MKKMNLRRILVPTLLNWLALACACANAGTLAQFRTPLGDLEVELYDKEKPATVANFKKLVQSGHYQNTFFHRRVPGFVVQGGGFLTFDPLSTNFFGPAWTNLGNVQHFGTVTNEFNVGPKLSNTNGTIAMAKTAEGPDSATCQWFFNLANNSTNLDNQNGGFTVFGHVVRDTGPTNYGGLLGLFNLVSYGNGMVNVAWWYPADSLATGLFQSLPVTYFNGPYQPWYSDLVYIDISLLSVQVVLADKERRISWNSISDRTNVVEYTTQMPPVWSTLVRTNGTGGHMTVSDRAPSEPSRFYRVRVLY